MLSCVWTFFLDISFEWFGYSGHCRRKSLQVCCLNFISQSFKHIGHRSSRFITLSFNHISCNRSAKLANVVVPCDSLIYFDLFLFRNILNLGALFFSLIFFQNSVIKLRKRLIAILIFMQANFDSLNGSGVFLSGPFD